MGHHSHRSFYRRAFRRVFRHRTICDRCDRHASRAWHWSYLSGIRRLCLYYSIRSKYWRLRELGGLPEEWKWVHGSWNSFSHLRYPFLQPSHAVVCLRGFEGGAYPGWFHKVRLRVPQTNWLTAGFKDSLLACLLWVLHDLPYNVLPCSGDLCHDTPHPRLLRREGPQERKRAIVTRIGCRKVTSRRTVWQRCSQ